MAEGGEGDWGGGGGGDRRGGGGGGLLGLGDGAFPELLPLVLLPLLGAGPGFGVGLEEGFGVGALVDGLGDALGASLGDGFGATFGDCLEFAGRVASALPLKGVPEVEGCTAAVSTSTKSSTCAGMFHAMVAPGSASDWGYQGNLALGNEEVLLLLAVALLLLPLLLPLLLLAAVLVLFLVVLLLCKQVVVPLDWGE